MLPLAEESKQQIAEKGMSLSKDMVAAILNGRKSLIIHPITLQNFQASDSPRHDWVLRKTNKGTWHDYTNTEFLSRVCPHPVGSRIWIKEPFWAAHDTDIDNHTAVDCGPCLDLGKDFHPGIQYCATPPNPLDPTVPGDWWEAPPDNWDGKSDYTGHGKMEWLPWSLYTKFSASRMPRWASRITAEITNVRIERIQDTTEEDAIAYSIMKLGDHYINGWPHRIKGTTRKHDNPISAFIDLWDHHHKNTQWKWADNPWVYKYTFKTINS